MKKKADKARKVDIELTYYEDTCYEGCCSEEGYIVYTAEDRSLGKIPDDAELILKFVLFDLKLTKHPGDISVDADYEDDTHKATIFLNGSPIAKVKSYKDIEEVLRAGISYFNKYTEINIKIIL